MVKINIKPLSVNEAWKGKRFKTEKYNKYERDLLLLLPKISIPNGDLKIVIEFGLSNVLSDFDNPVKPFIDVLQKKYSFNDRYIQEALIRKIKCEKGGDWVSFKITSM